MLPNPLRKEMTDMKTLYNVVFTNGLIFAQEKKDLMLLACKCCQTILPGAYSNTTSLVCPYCSRDLFEQPDVHIKMNHGVNDYGKWVPYVGKWRFKDRYDILLKDGTIIKQTYPNGGSFHNMNPQINPDVKLSRIEDEDVLMIRLVPDEEIVEKYHFTGDYRAERNKEYFGDAVPKSEDYCVIDDIQCILR